MTTLPVFPDLIREPLRRETPEDADSSENKDEWIPAYAGMTTEGRQE